jgi:hypothetical protein
MFRVLETSFAESVSKFENRGSIAKEAKPRYATIVQI